MENRLNAAQFAHSIDREPTQLVTFQWKFLRSPLLPIELIRRVKHKAVGWLRDRTGEPAIWLQYREMGKHKGDHLHWEVWTPGNLKAEFRASIARWTMAEATTATLHPKALRIDDIEPGSTLTWLRSYGVKESPTARELGLVTERHRAKVEKRAQPLPPVPGQRLHVAQAIDRAARKAAGYIDQPAAAFVVEATKPTNVLDFTARRPSPGPIPREDAAPGCILLAA